MALPYRKSEAKDYAREHMKGIWAAALTPFAGDGAIDEAAVRRNLRHWIDDLEIDGFFISGKQGEFFAMSLDERKRCLEIAVEECAGGPASTIMSCSDQNLDVVIDLAQHAEAVGSPYIVVHAPVLHFNNDPDDTVYEYYRLYLRAGGHRRRHVEPPRQRLSDEPGIVQPGRRPAERRGDQIQRAAGDVRPPHRPRQRPHPGQHRVGRRVVRQHRRAGLAALSLLLAALPDPDCGRQADARIYRPRLRRRDRAGARGARQPRSGAQGAQGHAPAGQAAQPPEILAGPARPDRRPCPPPRPAADRSREGGDAGGLQFLRACSGEARRRPPDRGGGEPGPDRILVHHPGPQVAAPRGPDRADDDAVHRGRAGRRWATLPAGIASISAAARRGPRWRWPTLRAKAGPLPASTCRRPCSNGRGNGRKGARMCASRKATRRTTRSGTRRSTSCFPASGSCSSATRRPPSPTCAGRPGRARGWSSSSGASHARTRG